MYHASLMRLDTDNKPSWTRNVKLLLCSHGMGQAWYNQGVASVDIFLKLFKERLLDNFRQNWHSRIDSFSRADFYKHIKLGHCPSNYLEIVIPKTHRNALARLFVSSHTLRVETGRWARPVTPREERKCYLCNKLEDEYHMVLECKLYKAIRGQLIPSFYWQRPSMFKLIDLMIQSDILM